MQEGLELSVRPAQPDAAEDRCAILTTVARMRGPAAYRLTPYKPVWIRWGAPATSTDHTLEGELKTALARLTSREMDVVRRYLSARTGSKMATIEARAESYRVYDGHNCIAIAYTDPHTLLVSVTWTFSTPDVEVPDATV